MWQNEIFQFTAFFLTTDTRKKKRKNANISKTAQNLNIKFEIKKCHNLAAFE